MSKLGLVFSGGGGKGAYEIGVWKALKEFGLDHGVLAVAGTSVGGLNGALFVQGDYTAGEHLWHNVSSDKILKIDVTKFVSSAAKLAAKLSIPQTILADMALSLKGRGWFTQAGLQQLIAESGVCAAVKNSKIPFHVCALNGNTGKLELPQLNGRPEDEIEKWLLASAAIPLVFGSVEINGQHYHDGGVLPLLSNNTPYQPLIEQHGCSHILSIFLDDAPLMRKAQERYPCTKFWNIVPTKGFKGGVTAALNFTADNARELIERGYADTKNILMQFREFQKTEENALKSATKINASASGQQQQIEENNDIRNGHGANLTDPLTSLDQLQAKIDRRELDLIDTGLENFLEDYTDNSQQMQEAMFEGIATLASTEGRIKHQMNRGIFSRIWGGITGKSNQLNAEIQWDLNRAIYFNQCLVNKLAQRNALTLEVVSSLETRLTYVMSHSNYLTDASRFHQKAIGMLAEGMKRLQSDMQRRMNQVETRLDQVEQRTDLQMWLFGLPQEVKSLSAPAIVLCAAKKFYDLTDGAWQRDEYHALEGQISSLCETKACSLRSLADAHESSPLRLDSADYAPLIADTAVSHPAYSAIHPASSSTLLLLEERGIACNVEIPVTQLVTELLCSMRLRDRRKNNLFNNYTRIAKDLTQLCQQTGLSEYDKPLQQWRQEIRDYRVLVPLIGKFSAGKSTLLNAFLGRELLGVDIDPETAEASELCYSQQEHAEGVYLDGQVDACSDVTAQLSSADTNPLWFYRRYLDNQQLQNLDKLVPVDMPGLESTKLNHEKAIANYMERGEVFLGVLSSETAFDESVMQVLREAHGKNKELHLVVTKCGRQTSDKLTEIRTKLAVFFAGTEPQPEIVLVESRTGEPGVTEFTALLYQLSSRFNDFFKARFEPTLHRFEDQIRAKLASELKLACCDDVELKQQMVTEQKTFAKLHETVRKERFALKRWLTGAGVEQCVAAVLSALSEAESQLLSTLETGTLQQTIAAIVRPIVQDRAKRVADEAVAEFTKRLEKVLTAPGADLHFDIAVMSPELKEGNSGNLAAGVGAALGFAILGPLGAAIGAVIGKIFGNNKAKVREENRTLIQSQVIPQVLDSVCQQLTLSLGEYADQVADSTQEFIDQQRTALETRRSEMLENLQQKRQEFQDRRQNLQQAIDHIDRRPVAMLTN